MRKMAIAISLISIGVRDTAAQQLLPTDIAAIERVAATYVANRLPQGIIGFDGTTFGAKGRTIARDLVRVDAIALALNAQKVRTDSVFICAGTPDTCRLSVAALVRIGVPVASPEGARVKVEMRLRSRSVLQPVSRGVDELILSKQDGSWKVVGIGERNVS